jgi:excisionase family DNA binding protein
LARPLDLCIEIGEPQMHGDLSVPANRPAALASAGHSAGHDRLACSVPTAARRLDVNPMTLYREIRAGRIAAIKIRDRLSIPETEIERLLTEAFERCAAELRRLPQGGDVESL